MKPFKDFAVGVGYIFRGFSYFLGKKDLWKYTILPFMINLLLLSVTLAILTNYIGGITEYFRNLFGLTYKDLALAVSFHKILFILYNALIWLLKILVGIIAFIIWGVILFIACQIVTSPFYEALSEKIEKKERRNTLEINFMQNLRFCRICGIYYKQTIIIHSKNLASNYLNETRMDIFS